MTRDADKTAANLPPIPLSEPMRAQALSSRKPNRFDLKPDAATRAALANYLAITDVTQLRFKGEVTPKGRHDFRLSAVLEAVVVQPCAITLEPVTTEIREEVLRVFIAELDYPTADEMEVPEDDTTEPLGEVIDIGHVATEALSLALPPFPRAEGATLSDAQSAPPGATPLDDGDLKPFAGLAALKAKLQKDGSGSDDSGV